MTGTVFNLDERRPKVLLLGNGLVYRQQMGWPDLIESVCVEEKKKYLEMFRRRDGGKGFLIPNSMVSLATSVEDDKDRREKYADVIKKDSEPNENISKLLELPFDAILTTNYSYEIEATQRGEPVTSGLLNQKWSMNTYREKSKWDAKYLIRSFNRVSKSSKDVWHIHGEARRPSSIILSYDEYVRLVWKILEYNKYRANDYQMFRSELAFKSWIDYFILGDLYILGLGMDYSEFDLWWLLERRIRENSEIGTVYFYEPFSAKNEMKHQVLRATGVEVQTLDARNVSGSDGYDRFYKKAIEDIKQKVTQ